MSKKIISIFMSMIVAASLVGCGMSINGKIASSTDSAEIIECSNSSDEELQRYMGTELYSR